MSKTKRPERLRNTSDGGQVGALRVHVATPASVALPPQGIEDVRRILRPYPLQAVLMACARESSAVDVEPRHIPDGPLKGSYVSLPGIAFTARQALIACEPSASVPTFILPQYRDAIRRASVVAYHLTHLDEEGDPDDRWATSVLLRYSGLHPPLPEQYPRSIGRYLVLFAEPIKGFEGYGTLADAFEAICGVQYEECLAIGFLIMVLATKYGVLTMDRFVPLWMEMPWRTWCTAEKVRTVVNLLSLPLDEHRRHAAEPAPQGQATPDELFAFNPLIKHPLVRFDDGSFLAPIPQYIVFRLTEGATRLLSDATSDPSAKANPAMAAVGHAVESYVGHLLREKFGDGVMSEKVYRGHNGEKRGPDFVLVHDRDVLLLEVKKVQPKMLLNELGNVDDFVSLLAMYVASPLRRLPEKQAMVLEEDTDLMARLPSGPRRVSHAVVTLGAFIGQGVWWSSSLTPLLTQVRSKTVQGQPYDPTFPHHLISLTELEDATSDMVPHIIKMLQRTWRRGPGRELFEELQRYRGAKHRHPVLDSARESWVNTYLVPDDLKGRL